MCEAWSKATKRMVAIAEDETVSDDVKWLLAYLAMKVHNMEHPNDHVRPEIP